MIKKCFFLPLLMIALFTTLACNKQAEENQNLEDPRCGAENGKINLRLENDSPYNFCCVVLDPAGNEAEYGIILRGETSCYEPFSEAYRFAYIRLSIGNDEFEWQPPDLSGETALSPGDYTYTIEVINYDQRELSFQLKL